MAEALSLLEAIAHAVYVQEHLSMLLGISDIPILSAVDNKSMVEAVHSTKLVMINARVWILLQSKE